LGDDRVVSCKPVLSIFSNIRTYAHTYIYIYIYILSNKTK
jgi:hypothetical protein